MTFTRASFALATLAAFFPLAARAAYGDTCVGFGTECDTYAGYPIYCGNGDNGELVCGGNGASCPGPETTLNFCYNYCGTDNICGSAGAGCDSTTTAQATFDSYTCSPGFTCNLLSPNSVSGAPGTCYLGASQGVTTHKQRMKRLQIPICRQEGSKACLMGAGLSRYGCVDVESNLEQCGGCSARDGGVDCSMLPNVDEVACIKGSCVVKSCTYGFMLSDGECF